MRNEFAAADALVSGGLDPDAAWRRAVEEADELPGDAYTIVPEAGSPVPPSILGRPRTWTGRVVSLDEWRRLSEWERSGPNGRVWDGIKQDWVYPDRSV